MAAAKLELVASGIRAAQAELEGIASGFPGAAPTHPDAPFWHLTLERVGRSTHPAPGIGATGQLDRLTHVRLRTDEQPRPSFHLDMSPEEKEIMQRHVAYWSKQAELGVAIVFGPVMDPRGVYGIGVYRVDDLSHMERLLGNDPAHGLLQFEILEMPRAVVGQPPA